MACAAGLAHRAALDGRVGAERHRGGAVDPADRGEHAGVVLRRDQLDGARVEELLAAGRAGCAGRQPWRPRPSPGRTRWRSCCTLLTARATLWPPKPNELLRASSSPSGSARGSPRTTSRCTSSSGSSRLVVGGRLPVPQREDGGDGLDRAGRAEQVTGHRLGAGHAQPVDGVAERLADRLGLGHVADRRRGGVRVDVHHVGRRRAGRLDRHPPSRGLAPAPTGSGWAMWWASEVMPAPAISP